MSWLDKVTLLVLFIAMILILFGEYFEALALCVGWFLGVICAQLDEETK